MPIGEVFHKADTCLKIISIIKGSIEALDSTCGHLTQLEYEKKRSALDPRQISTMCVVGSVIGHD